MYFQNNQCVAQVKLTGEYQTHADLKVKISWSKASFFVAQKTLYTINIIYTRTVNITQHQCKKELTSFGSSHNLACWQFRFKVAASQFVVFTFIANHVLHTGT